ncbi:hypothetical protein CDAR_168801 [Caerostris darwini]|uniref:Uncharacterized protein n=1 Tax=Caerostris darwini TaxID=1538125 RepID=A0AAV4WRU6_9ARAC|nr:hypothetical protein CDAR_168801 [Caerostris darwini]
MPQKLGVENPVTVVNDSTPSSHSHSFCFPCSLPLAGDSITWSGGTKRGEREKRHPRGTLHSLALSLVQRSNRNVDEKFRGPTIMCDLYVYRY